MADVKTNWTADTDKAIAGLQRLINKQAEQIEKLKEGKGEAEGFGRGMDAITSKVGQFLSLAAAVSAVASGLREVDQIRRQAGEGLAGEEANQKRLAQIAFDTADIDRLQGLGQTISERFGIPRAEALGLVFQGKSLQLSEAQILETAGFKRFAADVSPLFEATAGIRAAFGAQAAGGTQESITNALLSAAKETKVGVEDIARVSLGPAQAVKALGGTAEETLAALSVATVALASPEEAATAVGRFADVLRRDERFAGTGLRESLRGFAELSPEERGAVLGENVRARRGAGVLLERLDQFDKTLETINQSIEATGTSASEVARATRIATTDPELRAIEIARGAQVTTESRRRERLGVAELRKEAVAQILAQRLDEADGSGFFRALDVAFVEAPQRAARAFGVDEDFLIRGAAKSISERTGAPVEQVIREFKQAIEAFVDGAKTVKETTQDKSISITSVGE